MNQLFVRFGAVSAPLGVLFYGMSARAQLLTTTADTIISDTVGDVTDVLTTSLPVVFAVLGVLVGLFFVWRQVTKRIGRAK